MNVAMILRSSARKQLGGDLIQLTETARSLSFLGCNASIHYADEDINYEQYDIIHFSNIIRPSDIIRHIKKSSLPFVVSTIFVEYKPEDSGFKNALLIAFFRKHPHFLEYLKCITRGVLRKDLFPTFTYLLLGQKNSINFVIDHCSCLLPNSNSEIKRMESSLNRIIKNYVTIYNGVSDVFFRTTVPNYAFKDAVMCVGRVEPLKNQLMLIRASKKLPYHFYIIGSASANTDYYNKCREEAGANVTFIDQMSQVELASAFRAAKLHVLLSHFETTGLASLEAASCGCNIIVTPRGDQQEYFNEIALFCDPTNGNDIICTIEHAMSLPRNAFNQESIIQQSFTWQKAAEKTIEVYRSVVLN